MATSILTMLKAVPWSDVLSAAPSVVGGARKLWDSVGSKAAEPAAGEEAVPLGPNAGLSARLDRAEQEVAVLKSQMVAASGLITKLADQNAQLIATMEAARRRTRLLAGAVAAMGVACVVLAVFVVRLG